MFEQFDTNGDGTISLQELKEDLVKLGSTSVDEVLKTLVEIDTDVDRSIDKDEFAVFCSFYPNLVTSLRNNLFKNDGTVPESVLLVQFKHQKLRIPDLKERLADICKVYEDVEVVAWINEQELVRLRPIVIFHNTDRDNNRVLSLLELNKAVLEVDGDSDLSQRVLGLMTDLDMD